MNQTRMTSLAIATKGRVPVRAHNFRGVAAMACECAAPPHATLSAFHCIASLLSLFRLRAAVITDDGRDTSDPAAPSAAAGSPGAPGAAAPPATNTHFTLRIDGEPVALEAPSGTKRVVPRT